MPRNKSREPVDIFTAEEVALILETCRKMRPDYYPIFLTAFRTGMRIGEVLALRWDDVNWRNRHILVQRSFRNSRLTPTKNGKSRKVDMSEQLYTELKRLYVQRKEEALKDGLGEPVPIIFHNKGEHTSQNSVRNIWRRLLTKCGIDYRKLHTTRHTFASMLIFNGESLAYVKELMGHHSIQMTVDVYGHLLPTENRAAVNALDDAPIRTPGAPTQKEKAVTI
jgi:integrase